MTREVFTTSRQLEFFSQSELTAQIGYPPDQWAIALLKELIDNSLDACEMAGKPPVIGVEVEQDYFAVSDNGPGLPESVLKASLDYSVRVSDKQNYVSPSRGQQGNALKTLWAAPLVLDGEKGSVTVITAAYGYRVDLSIDQIAQAVSHELTPIPDRQDEGTLFKIHSPRMVQQLEGSESYRLIKGFALFNPHAHFIVNGESFQLAPVEGFKKWRPDYPTSPHWYDVEALTKLASGLLAKSRERRSPATIREFIKQFDGLKRTDKQKAIGEAMEPDATLEDLVSDKDMDKAKMGRLLSLMKGKTNPIKPAKLGTLGRDFIFDFLTASNCQMEGFKYKKSVIDDSAAPCIVEVAIAYHANPKQITFWGLNFTPIPKSLPWDISHYLQDGDVLIDDGDPIVLAIHITMPKFGFTDRGKSDLKLPFTVKYAIKECLVYVAKEWARETKKKRRSEQTTLKELNEVRKAKNARISDKAAAYQVMERAYMAASDNNRLPANARQIMYQARPLILELTGKGKLSDKYFTQNLLPDYIRDNPETTANWDVLYDARGHFVEPHTGKDVELGTLEVRSYLRGFYKSISTNLDIGGSLSVSSEITTHGNYNRYKFALFIEKEGFVHILESANIAQRYDIAIFSTKGMSNTSARQLVEKLSSNGVTILVAHDFDKSGLTIARTLGDDTRRYQFDQTPNVIDIGLRLSDVVDMGLGSEPFSYGKSDPRPELKNCNCTQAEIDFLCSHKTNPYSGDRVELNAMTSSQLIEWLEAKFQQYGVTKFIPDDDTLVEVYRLQARRRCLEKFVKEKLEKEAEAEIKRLEDLDIPIPDQLPAAVQDILKKDPLIPWDRALWRAAKQFQENTQEDLAG
jgi:DNA topoisomerase VI subunit B